MSRQKFHGALPPQKAILLYGVPGNGKTFMAKAIAGELGLNFLQVSGGQLLDK
jgi:transitional endoplasmic reticulum ATPase